MQQTELSPQLQQALRYSERHVQVINYVLAVLLTILLLWAAYASWRNSQLEKIKSITLVDGSVTILSQTSLCPGDTLTIRFVLDIQGTGAIVADDAVTHQNQTVKFSRLRREYIPESSTRTYVDEWTIPTHPEMAIDTKRAWLPGQYTRFISIAASNSYVNRYTNPASFSVPFFIKHNC